MRFHLIGSPDYIVYFAKVNSSTAHSFKNTMNILTRYSDLEINLGKSSICFSKHMIDYVEFCNIVNLQAGSFPLKYWGIPLMDEALTVTHFSSLIDKIYSWLAGWKSKFLFLVEDFN